MTAATAPSPSPGPSTSIPSTPTRPAADANASHQYDGASASSRQLDTSSTTDRDRRSTTNDTASASSATPWPAASSSARSDLLPPPPSLATPVRVLPPAPIQSGSDRLSTPSKAVRLPTPYKAPRFAQSGASESFATAYPSQETRQKYASPAKPLSLAAAATAKRTWQASTASDVAETESANKRLKSSIASSSMPDKPSDVPSTSSNVTITGIPKPGSSISNQISPPDLQPSVSGTDMPTQVKNEYLSLLEKPELIDMIKQLERQLLDILAAPAGSSTLYYQARIYPAQINVQIEKLKTRQRTEAAKQQALAQKSPLSAANLSLKDVYALLNAKIGGSTARGAVNPSANKSMANRALSTPRRPFVSSAPGNVSPSKAATAASKPQSLNSLIHSINALVGQQSQPARGPTGAPLAPLPPIPRPASAAIGASSTKHTTKPSAASLISPAMLKSIVGDGPMPSNAALAAALDAHFGGSLPAQAQVSSTSGPYSGADPVIPSASQSAGPGKNISAKIAAILGSSASTTQTTMLGPQGLPLAPATGGGNMQIGNIAAMLSSLSTPNAGQVANTSGSSGTQGQNAALSHLFKQLEEAKKTMPAANQSTTVSAGQDPIAILTGASANPIFVPTYPESPAYDREVSWSPEPEPVIVQGLLGTSTLPSYEDMIVEGLLVKGDSPPRTLFNWMQETYPLTKNFRPSASQALQKAFKRGRLLKNGSTYMINPNWRAISESRKPTRRPQVEKDHPMLTPGLNGEVLAVSPHKDSQAYRNVADSRIKTNAKGSRPGPKPYGQPGADPLPNPASSIFQTGSMTSVILEYKRHTGKELDADSIKKLYQHIRASPSNATPSEVLSSLLAQTGYPAAAAAVTAANRETRAPSVATQQRPTQRLPDPMSNVARGPTSLPLPTTTEPMMQQLARMLNDLSSPIDPALANSLLGQLSSNAAASASAAQAANAQRALNAYGSGPSDMLASALSAVSGQQSQQDLDSAVSETLAAALQQIGASSSSAPAAATTTEPAAPISSAPETATKSVPAEPAEGIDLTDYQDAIRALTSAFGGKDGDGDAGEESDEEADERAIAAAEADPVAEDGVDRRDSKEPSAPVAEPQSDTYRMTPDEDVQETTDEQNTDAPMDLSSVLRQLTASLQTAGDENVENKTASPPSAEPGSADVAPETGIEPKTVETAIGPSDSDEATLQSQLEALVASLAANASDDEDEDDDEEEDDEDGDAS